MLHQKNTDKEEQEIQSQKVNKKTVSPFIKYYYLSSE